MNIENGSLTIIEAVGSISLSHTIYLKDRRVVVKEILGERDNEYDIGYDDLPNPILKAYEAWIAYLRV